MKAFGRTFWKKTKEIYQGFKVFEWGKRHLNGDIVKSVGTSNTMH
jgi:hypothetical protein